MGQLSSSAEVAVLTQQLPIVMGGVRRRVLTGAMRQSDGTRACRHERDRVARTLQRAGFHCRRIVAEDGGLAAPLDGPPHDLRARACAIRQHAYCPPALQLAVVQLHAGLEAHYETKRCQRDVLEH